MRVILKTISKEHIITNNREGTPTLDFLSSLLIFVWKSFTERKMKQLTNPWKVHIGSSTDGAVRLLLDIHGLKYTPKAENMTTCCNDLPYTKSS